MTSNIFQKIREQIDLKQFIENFRKIDKNNKFQCLFHKDTNPSACIYKKKGKDFFYWHCFVCNFGGDITFFVSKMLNNSSQSEAAKFLMVNNPQLNANEISNDCQPKIEEVSSQPADVSLKASILNSDLRKRIATEGMGFLKKIFPKLEPSNENIMKLLGWDHQHWSIAILINEHTIKTRMKRGMNGKWFVTKGSSSTNLFPKLLFLASNREIVVVCEGEKDAINLYLNGITAITLGGAGGDWSKHKDILKGCGQIVLAFDADPAGVQAREKAIKALSSLGIPMKYIDFSKLGITLKKGYDISDFLEEYRGFDLFSHQICLDVEKEKIVSTNEAVKEIALSTNEIETVKVVDNTKFEHKVERIKNLLKEEYFKISFEDFLKTFNLSAYYEKDKEIYIIFNNEEVQILFSGNKVQIPQLIKSTFSRFFNPNMYCSFSHAYTFYSPSGTFSATNKMGKPINLYKKPKFALSATPITEIPPNIKKLFDNLIQDLNHQDNFINWIACSLQTGVKSQVAHVIISPQGIGKGTLGKILGNLFGEGNCRDVTNKMMQSEFNDFMEGSQLLILNEIENKNHAGSRKINKNSLKILITEPAVFINSKGKKGYFIENVFNILMFTNEGHPIDIEEDDRRYTVIHSTGLPIEEVMGTDYSTFFPIIMSEVPDFYNFLMNYKCDFNKYNTSLETDYKTKLKSMSQTLDERIAFAIAKKDIAYFEEFLQESIVFDDTHILKENIIQELKSYLEKLFIPNEFICKLYRSIKGSNSDICATQDIKFRLQKTGVFEKYKIIDKQTTLNGRTTRGIQFPS